jgi:hypothetical protein
MPRKSSGLGGLSSSTSRVLRKKEKTDFKQLAEVGRPRTPRPIRGKRVVPAPKKKKVDGVKKSAPTYLRMVTVAISNLDEPHGSSVPAIVKFIQGKYPQKCNRGQIWMAVKRGEKEKRFTRYKLRFRLTQKNKEPKSPKKKKTTPKPKTPKSPKNTTKEKTPKESPKKKTTSKKTPKQTKEKPTAPPPVPAPAKKGRKRSEASTEQPATTKKAATTKRSKKSTEPSGEPKGTWQYQDKGWKNYADPASNVVEKAYQEWQKDPYTDIRSVKSGQWAYQVDFNRMKQINIEHENHTERDIRRI